jgi:hypothetical protein
VQPEEDVPVGDALDPLPGQAQEGGDAEGQAYLRGVRTEGDEGGKEKLKVFFVPQPFPLKYIIAKVAKQ